MADGLSDAEIAEHLNEGEQLVSREIQGILTELGFRTRTHAIVYVLAREISGAMPRGRPPVDRRPQANDADSEANGTEERPA